MVTGSKWQNMYALIGQPFFFFLLMILTRVLQVILAILIKASICISELN